MHVLGPRDVRSGSIACHRYGQGCASSGGVQIERGAFRSPRGSIPFLDISERALWEYAFVNLKQRNLRRGTGRCYVRLALIDRAAGAIHADSSTQPAGHSIPLLGIYPGDVPRVVGLIPGCPGEASDDRQRRSMRFLDGGARNRLGE